MNFEAAANETFQILRSYDYEVSLYNDEHNKVFEPEDARRFFAEPENLLVSIVDDGEDSAVRLYLSKSTKVTAVIGLISALRMMATKYQMVFHVRKYERVLNAKDFGTQASVRESSGTANNKNNGVSGMNITEGMYGTSRSSYMKLENARMIVRHSNRVNENVLGARGRNIDSIYIENNVGERHLFPSTHLAPARAMTHHVSNGGSWADPVGEQIGRMARDFADMAAVSRHVNYYGNDLSEDAQDLRMALRECMRTMRRTFEGVCRKTKYQTVCEALQEEAAKPLTESEGHAEHMAELAEMLNTDSVSLSESVLATVARVVEAEADRRMKLGDESKIPMIYIMGRKVDANAWNEFKAGKIELARKPDLNSEMRFASPTAKIGYVLRQVVPCIKNDSMMNLFSYVMNDFDHASPEEKKGMLSLATALMKRLNISLSEGVDTGIGRGSEAVREYMAWAYSHGSLLEADDLDAEEDDAETDDVEDDAEDDAQNDSDDALNESEVDEDCGNCPEDEAAKPELSEDEFDEADLTQEDILLPKDQGKDLISDVTKATVTDPDSGEEKEPDDSYISRLITLAGNQGR